MKLSFVLILCFNAFIISISALCNSNNNSISTFSHEYCSYYKRIDLSQVTQSSNILIFKHDEHVLELFSDLHDENDLIYFKIKSVYSEYLINNDQSLSIDEHNFYFKFEKSLGLIFGLNTESFDILSLINKSVKFKLKTNLKCYITIDFYKSNYISMPSDDFSSLINSNDQTLINYEIDRTEFELDLRKILPQLFCESKPYSIVCLKCNSNQNENSLLNMSILNDLLKITLEAFEDKTLFYNDIVLLIEQESLLFESPQQSNRFYLNIRVYNLESDPAFSLDKRSKRYSGQKVCLTAKFRSFTCRKATASYTRW